VTNRENTGQNFTLRLHGVNRTRPDSRDGSATFAGPGTPMGVKWERGGQNGGQTVPVLSCLGWG
jgi:hypothetical protein